MAKSIQKEESQGLPAMASLVAEVRALVQSARREAAASINRLQVMTNFEIGRLIVEHEQGGSARAEYGKETLKHLSAELTREFGRGFSRANLEYMRRFHLMWSDQFLPISQTVSGNSANRQIPQTTSAKSRALESERGTDSEPAPMSAAVSRKSGLAPQTFPLSWSHYVLLMGVRNEQERSFYEIEAAEGGWSLAELKRQVASGLYERLALSRDKDQVRRLAEEGQVVERAADILKSPYVLEFLGLDEKHAYSESDLESAIIDKLEHFLLELGKGFLFEARQKRFTFDEDHYFVDLVFYNRLLRCHVLIDLKLDKVNHQDLGQMQLYVNYYDRHVRLSHENRTIGILLCKRKNDAVVEITLPPDANIHAAEYQLYLPSKEELKAKLLEWGTEES